MKKAVVFLAEGFEEIEAVIPIDLLRRGDVLVTTVGIEGQAVKGAHGLTIQTDEKLEHASQFSDYDAIVLPGGMPGARNLSESWALNELIITMFNSGKLVCAICAAPAVVLGKLDILDGKNAVCYPGAEAYAPDCSFGTDPVVTDGNLITARGPGYAHLFGLTMLAALQGDAAAEQVRTATLFS